MATDGVDHPIASVPVLRIDSQEAREVADLSAIIQDLKFVNGCCERLWAELQKEDKIRDVVLIRALWTAALVGYWRCFGTGKRAPLSRGDVGALPLKGEVLEWHDHLCDLRNKHIAHSVNPFEQMAVGVILDSDGLPGGVSALTATHLTVDEDGVAQTASLTVQLVRALQDRLTAKQDEMIADLRGRGADATADLVALNLTIPGPQDGGRARN